MRRVLGTISWLACAVGLGGCLVYDPQLVRRGDTGPDGGGVCAGRRPPGRPSIPDGPDIDEVAFGLRDVFLDQGADWSSIGYDLDGLCSVSPDFATECTRGGPPQRDGDEGIDNVFGDSLYPIVEASVPGLEAMAVAAQDEGRGMPVLRIRHWNGTRNDPQVEVAIMQSVFGTSAEGPDGGPPEVRIMGPLDYTLADGSPVPLPAWDGEDYLWARTDAFLAGDPDEPFIVDDAAYVVDGEIVSRLPDQVDIVFPTDDIGVLVRLTEAVATGTLSEDGLELNPVVVAGRWRVVDLLSTAENIGICRGDSRYELLMTQLGRIADVRSMPPRPGDPPSPCDAISIGVRFRGSRARVVPTPTPGQPLADLCSAARADAGTPDAGPSDAGPSDAGPAEPDAPDTASPDAGADGG
jgi:hypothetical protein